MSAMSRDVGDLPIVPQALLPVVFVFLEMGIALSA
jgi:hypothetical protein